MTVKSLISQHFRERLNLPYSRARYHYDKEALRNRNLLKKYGMSMDDYKVMLKKQGHKCAICDAPEDLVVDHCHESGKVRGLLCRSCNTGLGMFKDGPDLLRKAADYL